MIILADVNFQAPDFFELFTPILTNLGVNLGGGLMMAFIVLAALLAGSAIMERLAGAVEVGPIFGPDRSLDGMRSLAEQTAETRQMNAQTSWQKAYDKLPYDEVEYEWDEDEEDEQD